MEVNRSSADERFQSLEPFAIYMWEAASGAWNLKAGKQTMSPIGGRAGSGRNDERRTQNARDSGGGLMKI